MNTKDGVKGCKKCGGKGWYVFDKNGNKKPCEDCCTHDGIAMPDPKDPNERFVCAQGCGKEMPVPKPEAPKRKK